MSIEDLDVIDRVADNLQKNQTVLVISDHLEWGADEEEHLRLLQEKIRTYLGFIETGEIYSVHPEAKGKSLAILVFFKYEPKGEMVDVFIPKLAEFLEGRGIEWQTRRIKSSMN